MDCDIQEKKYYAEDDEYRIHCDILNNFVIDRYYNNHLKSQTH